VVETGVGLVSYVLTTVVPVPTVVDNSVGLVSYVLTYSWNRNDWSQDV
jgi:hypothetical protein